MSDLSRRGFVVLGAATLLSACASTMPVLPKPGASPEQLTRSDILAAINATRAANGAPAWTYNQQLENAARSQARLMAQKDTLSHDLGVTLRERVRAAGYNGAVGENLAKGYPSLPATIQGWLDSPGHRSTLLNTKFVEFGLATARTGSGRIYWAMIAGGSFGPWLR